MKSGTLSSTTLVSSRVDVKEKRNCKVCSRATTHSYALETIVCVKRDLKHKTWYPTTTLEVRGPELVVLM